MFGQAMAFHLSLWYTKRDLAKRVGLFISAGSVSGAFGGLIAFGVQHIKSSSIQQWRILFLIEGCPSVLLAICVALFMPSRPDKSRLLNEEQRLLCLTRLNAENSVDDRPGIDWKGVKRTMTDWKTYVVSVGYVSVCRAFIMEGRICADLSVMLEHGIGLGRRVPADHHQGTSRLSKSHQECSRSLTLSRDSATPTPRRNYSPSRLMSSPSSSCSSSRLSPTTSNLEASLRPWCSSSGLSDGRSCFPLVRTTRPILSCT